MGGQYKENSTMKTFLACVLPLLLVSALLDDERLVTLVLEETDEILTNPGMGW